MSKNTKIEWCDHTFNPWEGCQKVSPGCDHCYAEARNARFGGGTAVNWGPDAPRRLTSLANWAQPLRWNKEAERLGVRYRVFCASLADVFDNAVPVHWRIELMHLMLQTPRLDWLLLTKRIGNAHNMLDAAFRAVHAQRETWANNVPPNIWIGATIISQEEADRDIPKLLAVPAAKRFLSMEPLLGPVDIKLMHYECSGQFAPDGREYVNTRRRSIHWVIVGGESGPNARPMHPDWARSLRDQCQAAGVPFLFKQWGEWIPADQSAAAREANGFGPIRGFEHIDNQRMHLVGKKAAGRMLDGREWNEVPAC